ncbi:hypothetical protein AB0G02_38815, partial [Actinosynnema sp. NPDC023658]
MLNIFARASVSRVTDPIGAWLLRRGLTPNAVTVLGTVGSVATSLWFIPRGQLFTGAALVGGGARRGGIRCGRPAATPGRAC